MQKMIENFELFGAHDSAAFDVSDVAFAPIKSPNDSAPR